MVDCAVLGEDRHAAVRFEVVAVDDDIPGIVHKHRRVNGVITLQGVEFNAPHALELGAAGDTDIRDRTR